MKKEKLPKTTLKFILHFLRPYYSYFSGITFISFFWAADRTIEPYIIKIILDTLENNLIVLYFQQIS